MAINQLVEFSLSEVLEQLQVEDAIENDNTDGFQGRLRYYHYGCDGHNDREWGCGYRTLQSLLSWVQLNRGLDRDIPSLTKVQDLLVEIGDKLPSFRV